MRIVDVTSSPEGVQPCRLRVRWWSGSSGPVRPPFVLVHGLSSNARLWDEVAVELAGAGHEVAAVDLRSHGESEAPADGYDTATAAEDVAAVCTSLFGGGADSAPSHAQVRGGANSAIVVGQSWGGNIAVRLAARHPNLVAAAGLVDGGWIDLTTTFRSWPACAAALRPPDVDGVPAAQLRRRIATGHPGWSPAAVEATLANLRELPDGTVQRRLAIDKHMRILRSMWDDPPWPDLAAIAVPVLLMAALPGPGGGERSRGDKRATLGRAVTALARGRVREYVGGDHDLHAQQPAALAADLLTLAAQTRGGGIDGRSTGHHGIGRDDTDHDKTTSSDI